MISDKGNKWQYTTDKLYIGNKLIKEVYVGTKKVYPSGANVLFLRDIVEDDARQYGDAGGQKYNWYIHFPDGNIYDSFGSGDRTLGVRIFCDYHPPHNGEYYERDLPKPVGFANYGDIYRTTIDGVEIEKPRMRWIWFAGQTREKTPEYVDGGLWGNAYTIPVNPYWHQGDSQGKYHVPGDNIIWFGWQWWMYQDTDHIYKYDFVKREFGPELTGADLWVPVDPYDPDS
jgi:hypothetical protein